MLTLRDTTPRLGRRDFFRIGTLGLGGWTLSDLLAARAMAAGGGRPVTNKSVIFLFLHGGPSQIETFDPKMDAPAEVRSTTGELPTTIPGITFGGTFPRLAGLAERMSIVRSYQTGDGNHDIKPIMGNPTRQLLEEAFAELEGGARGLAFASGMAALTTLFLHFSAGDHLVVSQDLYGGTYRVLAQVFGKFGLSASYVDSSDVGAVAAAIRPETRALLVETPGNPLLGVADLAALGALCRQHGLLYIVDNTFLTPVLQRPFAFGADVTVYSATKYFGGHNDLCAGVLVARTREAEI